jgi:hypothetical protein
MSYVSIFDSLSVNILLTILIPNFQTPQSCFQFDEAKGIIF